MLLERPSPKCKLDLRLHALQTRIGWLIYSKHRLLWGTDIFQFGPDQMIWSEGFVWIEKRKSILWSDEILVNNLLQQNYCERNCYYVHQTVFVKNDLTTTNLLNCYCKKQTAHAQNNSNRYYCYNYVEKKYVYIWNCFSNWFQKRYYHYTCRIKSAYVSLYLPPLLLGFNMHTHTKPPRLTETVVFGLLR